MQQNIDLKHLRGAYKTSRLKIKPETSQKLVKKPSWIRIKNGNSDKILKLKSTLRKHSLFTVCEEASCPNLSECFSKGTATFMIMGQICTRRCPFCDVAHGRPLVLDENEPEHLAKTIAQMALKYVVITSVDRDDLKDGGATHFKKCLVAIYRINPDIKIEILTPDFRGRLEKALSILSNIRLDVFNHNVETVPELYKKVRPGANYKHSLTLLKYFKKSNNNITTKSGLMLGLGEKKEQVLATIKDLRTHGVDMLTLGQYLQPSKHHLPVIRYLTPNEFYDYKIIAKKMGFSSVASAPMVRSSYHADLQALEKK